MRISDWSSDVCSSDLEENTRLLRRYDRRTRTLTLSGAMPPDSRRFALAHQLAALELAEEIAEVRDGAELRSEEARQLLSIGLTNYAAGALLMPYDRFRRTDRKSTRLNSSH